MKFFSFSRLQRIGIAMGCIALPLLAFAEDRRNCAELLSAYLTRISPSGSSRYYGVEGTPATSSLSPAERALFRPGILAESVDGDPFLFSLKTPEEFFAVHERLRDRGFWVVFNPSREHDRVRTGHVSVFVNRTYVSRNVDEQGAHAIQSLKESELVEDPGMLDNVQSRYVIAQFFELQPEQTASLEKYYNDRVWNYHALHPDYRTKYVPLPFTRNQDKTLAENCVTFVFSFMQGEWQALRPELRAIANQFGSVTVDEIPSRQIYRSLGAPSYRGSFLISRDPSAVEAVLTAPLLNLDRGLYQMRLKNSATKLSGEETQKEPAPFTK